MLLVKGLFRRVDVRTHAEFDQKPSLICPRDFWAERRLGCGAVAIDPDRVSNVLGTLQKAFCSRLGGLICRPPAARRRSKAGKVQALPHFGIRTGKAHEGSTAYQLTS